MSHATSIVEIENLRVSYKVREGKKIAIDNVTLSITKGETLAVLGESGSGKTTLGLAILKLVKVDEGKIYFKGNDITNLKEKEMSEIRKLMQLVPQDPYSSMNPKLRIKDIVGEPLLANPDHVIDKIRNSLEQVGLNPSITERYPHELSGGQRQRVLIARALISNPEFIVLDEPTSNLDVSIQAQILNLLLDLQIQKNLTYLFITHNISVAKYMADRIAILYHGKLVEIGKSKNVIMKSLHPYTTKLIEAVPSNGYKAKIREFEISEIDDSKNQSKGCSYFSRCPFAKEICKVKEPQLITIDNDHMVACHLYT
ncbi:oligopeptide/dipeptide ABC transporter, ATPase subunit [Sulfolobus islandicus M.14.25]|uniref:Oligopeptide/dipeptide ABC transporter, ATPase subunit n=1 Tax=Saccharolobus islandicus (strain M.14.25 / Kamchatka \|nr:ABC transporter ATP-binding protein [Sulfolobus islandicus]ACP39123.1 oligopeptide/dipeptide ABC transporter, ATPase subunit [Sulfolobus islandicus M.14.25]